MGLEFPARARGRGGAGPRRGRPGLSPPRPAHRAVPAHRRRRIRPGIRPVAAARPRPSGEPAAVAQYLANRDSGAKDPDWPWPEGVLPISHWGCAMYACVDCRTPQATVLLFEPNAGDVDHAWYVDAPSLADWLRTWTEGTGWYEETSEGPEPTPWTDLPCAPEDGPSRPARRPHRRPERRPAEPRPSARTPRRRRAAIAAPVALHRGTCCPRTPYATTPTASTPTPTTTDTAGSENASTTHPISPSAGTTRDNLDGSSVQADALATA